MHLVIAGVHSGVGKTTIVSGLVAALQRRGLTVQPFKVGPDYIDPSYLSLAAARPCRNLDSWMVSPERLLALFNHASQAVDISIIEGAMGLFDGLNYTEDTGSTAHIARLTHSPVLLILDASKTARSAAAIARGFQCFDPNVRVAGFIVNRVGSQSHGEGVSKAIQQATGLPVLGYIPNNPQLDIPERHLGLVPTAEAGLWEEFINSAVEQVSNHIDIEQVLSIADSAPPVSLPDSLENISLSTVSGDIPRPVIALARDEAFNFIYEDNIDLLKSAGAQIVYFSPLNDSTLPPNTDAIILSGGFPEIYAARLSANTAMRQALHTAYAQHKPIYAECGGLMALTESITDLHGKQHTLFGLLPGHSVMTQHLTLGYRLARASQSSWLMPAGETVRGHEFHYSIWENRPASLPPAYELLPIDGLGQSRPEGACVGSVWASYIHLNFWSQPQLALNFVRACS